MKLFFLQLESLLFSTVAFTTLCFSLTQAFAQDCKEPLGRVAGIETDKSKLKVALVQYEMGRPKTLADWEKKIEKYVEEATSNGADVIVFPELIALEGMTLIDPEGKNADKAIIQVAQDHTPYFDVLFSKLSQNHQVNILAGTWPKVHSSGGIYNVATLFNREGLPIIEQAKNHLTYDENALYFFKGGSGNARSFKVDGIDTRVAICFDCEFPNYLPFKKGTIPEMVLIPSMTSDGFGKNRVQRSASARAVEYHNYVLVTATVGGAPGDPVLGAHSGQAVAFTPSDKRFPEDGILAKGPLNKSHVLIVDLDFDTLRKSRKESTTFPVQLLHKKEIDNAHR